MASAGQTTVKGEGSAAAATKLYDKLVHEKTRKGYVEEGRAKPATAAPAKAATIAKSAPALDGVLAELKAFVAALKKRVDVKVTVAELGAKSSKAEAAAIAELPDELRAFFTAMNGAHVAWRFIEPPGAVVCTFQRASAPLFRSDDDASTDFGDDYEAMLLDEITPEGATWIVRHRATKACRIMFASQGEGDADFEVAGSIGEYLQKAMASGLSLWWPACLRKQRGVSMADQEAAIRRFQAPPRKPAELHAGLRVEVEYFAEGGRGTLLGTYEAKASDATSFNGTSFADVQLDAGIRAWIPTRFMKVMRNKDDAYERLRAALPTDLSKPLAVMEEIARATGGYRYRRAAGFLAAHPLPEAAAFVVALCDAAAKAGLVTSASRPLKKTGSEFTVKDWRNGANFYGSILIKTLQDGLAFVVQHTANSAGKKVSAIVEIGPLKRIAAKDNTATDHLTLAGLLKVAGAPPPIALAKADKDKLRALGLPVGAIMLSGSGY